MSSSQNFPTNKFSQDSKKDDQICFEYQASLVFKIPISRGFWNFPKFSIILISINAPKWRKILQKLHWKIFHSQERKLYFPKLAIFKCTKKVIVTLLWKMSSIKVPKDYWHRVSFPWLYLSVPALQK